MKHFKSDLKIIAVVCDPVHRTFSHYLHALNITRPVGWNMPGAQQLQHKWVLILFTILFTTVQEF